MVAPTVEEVRGYALDLGWDDVGFTTPEIPAEDLASWRDWIGKGLHGPALHYMESKLRESPLALFPRAKTAIIFISNYKQPKVAEAATPERMLVASYSRGRDYHQLHRSRCKQLIRWLEEKVGEREIALPFSDSKPLMEKCLAVRAGLGWFGKNSLLIHRRYGTFVLIAGVLTSLEFPTAPPLSTREARCGSCQRCLDACPTQALYAPYQIDARRCLSYHLIESKEAIPQEIAVANPGYLFGCDICQDVCPHNVRSPLSQEEAFAPSRFGGPWVDETQLAQWEEEPSLLFGSPLKRAGTQRLRQTFSLWQSEKGKRG